VGNASREAIISDLRTTGLSADVTAELLADIGPLWLQRHQANGVEHGIAHLKNWRALAATQATSNT
jgi:hypothetical protein